MKKTNLIILLVLLVPLLFQSCSSPLGGFFSSFRVIVDDDYSQLLSDPDYSQKVYVPGIKVITQEVSCGYAVLQMLAQWQNMDLTEDMLYEMNNHTVTTALGSGFVEEINRQFPQWNVTRFVRCTNTDFLVKIYDSLKQGFPVPFEWAAKDTEGNWTLHFSLVVGLDFKNNIVQIANPYGYMEELTIHDFIKATRFESYENMEWYFEEGFNIGLFNQNTVYVIEKK